MKLKILIRKGCIAMALCLAILSLSSDICANLNGHWIQHPAADLRTRNKECQVHSIIDGNRYVYFTVRSVDFRRNNGNFYASSSRNADQLTLWRYDKTQPWEAGCINSLAVEFDLARSIPTVLNYSPASGVLMAVNEDGSFDFFYDDDTALHTVGLASVPFPNSSRTYSITFDAPSSTAFIAGTYGYAEVDVKRGEVKKLVKLDKPVSWAGRIGDNMVIFAGNVSPDSYSSSTYVFPADKTPSVLDKPVSGGDNLQALMPLTSKSFAAVYTPGSDTSIGVKLFTLQSDGTLKGETVTEAAAVDNQAHVNFRYAMRADGFVSPTAEGFAVFNNTSVTLIKAGVDIDYNVSNPLDRFKQNAVKTISKSALSSTEQASKAATSNGTDFRFYSYQSNGTDGSVRGFYSRSFNGSSWTAATKTVSPSGPGNALFTTIAYNPKYGMMFRGPGSTHDQGSEERENLWSYKDGVWTERSANAVRPLYDTPLGGTRYISVDPLNADWIWGSTALYGLNRITADYSSNPVMLGHASRTGYETTYPGYKFAFDTQDSYRDLSNFSNVDFDNSGRMWFARDYLTGGDKDYEEYTEGWFPVYYLTADERLKIDGMSSSQIKALLESHKFVMPYAHTFRQQRLLALKGPRNDNYIVSIHKFDLNDCRRSVIFDHNGTLDNKADDRYAYFDDLYDENGEQFVYREETGIFEDELTGDLWFLTTSGPVIINPSDMLAGKRNCRRLHIKRNCGVEVDENPFEQLSIVQVAVDPLGRKWLASEQGLFCLSADNSELLAHYTVDNSPLPSNKMLTVGVDEVTGAVFASTVRGLVELHPEGSSATTGAGTHLTIWPEAVTPDYDGYVSISGAVEGASYEILAPDGLTVIALGKPSAGMIQWDGRDSERKKVAPGKYSVRRVGFKEAHPIIIQ